MVMRVGRVLLGGAGAVLAASLLLFSLLECVPRLVDVVPLQAIAYYGVQRAFRADPDDPHMAGAVHTSFRGR